MRDVEAAKAIGHIEPEASMAHAPSSKATWPVPYKASDRCSGRGREVCVESAIPLS